MHLVAVRVSGDTATVTGDALIDPYGLSLVSVQVWGLLWGFLSSGSSSAAS